MLVPIQIFLRKESCFGKIRLHRGGGETSNSNVNNSSPSDIFPLFANADLVEDCALVFTNHYKQLGTKIDAIVGLESRGFLLGPILALKLRIPFVPIRKPGKLPGEVKSVEYQLEYGHDKFEIQASSIKPGLRCIIFDDLLATGGSLAAATQLVEMCGGKVIECDVMIELVELRGRARLSMPVFPLLQY